jgi:hypothetical protein
MRHWNGSGWDASPLAGGAIAIGVGPSGNPWLVNNAGTIYEYAD